MIWSIHHKRSLWGSLLRLNIPMTSREHSGNSDSWVDLTSSSNLIKFLFPQIRLSSSGVFPHLYNLKDHVKVKENFLTGENFRISNIGLTVFCWSGSAHEHFGGNMKCQRQHQKIVLNMYCQKQIEELSC